MPKLRLGVAMLIPPPLDGVVDAWRLGLGDGARTRIPPHLTLVPPVNVREDALGHAVEVLRAAAAATRAFTVELGPPATFLPDNPVAYLPVAGDDAAVRAVRDRVFRAPLERTLSWPFVPHVTVLDDAPVERIEAALLALADAVLTVTFDRVHLLQEGEGRVWRPIAELPFGGPAVVGRGGLELELRTTTAADVDVRDFVERESASYRAGRGYPVTPPEPLVVTARRDGTPVACAEGWCRAPRAHLDGLIVAAAHRGEGIGRHVLAAFESEAAARGAEVLTAHTERDGPAEPFFVARGWRRSASAGPRPWTADREFVLLEKRL